MRRKLRNFFKLKMFKSVNALSEREFIEMIGDHKCMRVNVEIGLQPYNHEFHTVKAWFTAVGGPKIIFVRPLGYIQDISWKRQDERYRSAEDIWLDDIAGTIHKLEKQYCGLDVRISTVDGPKNLERIKRRELVAV